MIQENPTRNLENQDRDEMIEYNLRILETDMWAELQQESIGGNAGYYAANGKQYPCGGMRAHIDSTTGKFRAFHGSLPTAQEAKELGGTISFMIRIAMSLDSNFSRIVEWYEP